jgi:glycosyltransferase involved in cell wall biosynthesis
MRISYLLAGLGYTGGYVVLYRFMDKLCEGGHEVFAVTPRERIRWSAGLSGDLLGTGLGGRLPTLLDVGRQVVARQRWLKGIFRRVAKRASTDREPIVHVKWLTEGLLRNWIQSDVTISTFCTTSYANYLLMDNTCGVYHMQHYEELFFDDPIWRKMARLTYCMPLVLVANSSWLQMEIEKRFARTSHLLNPGVDHKVFYPRVSIEQKYGASTTVRIVSYYSPVKFKAWSEALEAMKLVFEKRPRGVEWIVFGGEPAEKPQVPVRFVGRVFGDELSELYSSAHIVFMNSWYESFPLPPIEGMACGSAVITTRTGTEDYAVDWKNAVVIPSGDPRMLAGAICHLADNPGLARDIALAGVETARQFTWDKAVQTLEGILRGAIRESPRERFRDVERLLAGVPTPGREADWGRAECEE